MVGERSGAVFRVDADTLEPIGDRIELHAVVQDVFATPDPRTVLALLAGKSYALIDFVDGHVIEADLGVDPAWVDISPDGTRLAVGSHHGRGRRGRHPHRPLGSTSYRQP